MAVCVCNGAMLRCHLGDMPSVLQVIPSTVNTVSNPAATIMDFTPMLNIMPFGMCGSMSNPAVASINVPGALRARFKAPCIPNTAAPWIPGSNSVLIENLPALNNTSKLLCLWAGIITVMNPGQNSVMVP